MKNKKVTILLIIAVLAVLCSIVLIFVFSKGAGNNRKKNLKESFFNSSDEQYAKELIDNNGKKYVIDDYTITLEESLYDEKTKIGYCVFAITKKDGKPEIELNEYNQSVTDGYGENGRFRMKVFASQGSRFEIVGDTLYQYFSFGADEEFHGKVKVLDTMNRNKAYKYTLADIGKYNEYVVSDSIIMYISPLGIVVNSGSEIRGEIALHYKDGSEEVVLNTEDGTGMGLAGVSKTNGDTRSRYVFKELKKIENIEYILFNGEKISKK